MNLCWTLPPHLQTQRANAFNSRTTMMTSSYSLVAQLNKCSSCGSLTVHACAQNHALQLSTVIVTAITVTAIQCHPVLGLGSSIPRLPSTNDLELNASFSAATEEEYTTCAAPHKPPPPGPLPLPGSRPPPPLLMPSPGRHASPPPSPWAHMISSSCPPTPAPTPFAPRDTLRPFRLGRAFDAAPAPPLR